MSFTQSTWVKGILHPKNNILSYFPPSCYKPVYISMPLNTKKNLCSTEQKKNRLNNKIKSKNSKKKRPYMVVHDVPEMSVENILQNIFLCVH